MTQLVRAVAIRDRWIREVERLAVEAMDNGENQTLVAQTIGRSREHLRTVVRRRVEERQAEEAARKRR